MFKRILLPLDGTKTAEAAVPHALALAATKGCKLTILHVLENDHDGHRTVEPMEWHMRKAAATLTVEKIANSLRQSIADVDVQVLSGSPSDRIIECASQRHSDLVILTRRDGKLGGVARKTVEHIGRSVLLVHPGVESAGSAGEWEEKSEKHLYNQILAPLDGSPRAECVLPIVQSLALHQRALVCLANVVAKPWMASAMPLTADDRDLMGRLVARAEDRAQQYLANVATHFAQEQRIALRTANSIAEELHAIVEQEKIDLVVLSAHGATNDRVRPYGGIATDFVSYAKSNVLIFQDAPAAKESSRDATITRNSTKDLNMLARSYA